MPTTFEKTWLKAYNQVPTNTSVATVQKHALWFIKALLKGEIAAGGGTYTVEGSSDSSTAGLDGTDRWGASFDATKIVPDTAGNAHSWIVLKKGSVSICIDYSVAPASGHTCTFAYSQSAFTGGSTTARPTSTAEWVHTAQQFHDNSTTAWHVHGVRDTDGDFVFLTSKDGSARFWYGTVGIKTVDAKATDTNNFFTYHEYNGTLGPFLVAAFSAIANWKGRNFDNTAGVNLAALTYVYQGANTQAFADMNGVDAIDNKYDDLPMYCYTQTSGHKSIRGRLPDLRWAPPGLTDGQTEPAGGGVTATVAGDVWLPADVSPIL